VVRAGFCPVPRTTAARPQLHIAEPVESLDLDETPAVVDDARRRLLYMPKASTALSVMYGWTRGWATTALRSPARGPYGGTNR
jgi:hypothetical protein